MPIDEGFRRNNVLSTHILEWATGKSLDIDTPVYSKRNADAIADTWSIRLLYGLNSWTVELPPDSPLSLLMDLAFRCLNTKMPIPKTRFKLCHDRTHFSFDSIPLNSTAIKNGDRLTVETTPEPQQTQAYYGSDSMCLIKLYRSDNYTADACFWVPRDTETSVLSLLIRYWHWSESDFIADSVLPSQIEAWTPVKDPEDFLKRYWILDSSMPLRAVIRDYALEGWLENEPIFEKPHTHHGIISITQTLPDYRPYHQSPSYTEDTSLRLPKSQRQRSGKNCSEFETY